MQKKNKGTMLKMFNNIWLNDQFPNSCKTAMIIILYICGSDLKNTTVLKDGSLLIQTSRQTVVFSRKIKHLLVLRK